MSRKLIINFFLFLSILLFALSPVMYQVLINLYDGVVVNRTDTMNFTAGFTCFLLPIYPLYVAIWLGIYGDD